MNENEGLEYAIEEAFAGDFTALRERSNLGNAHIEALEKLREDYFAVFKEYIKQFIAMQAAMQALKDKE